MKPKELFVFVTSTATIVHGGLIWDPDCLYSECVGDPLVGDGFSTFDDWTGSRKYSTKVHFTCNEGIGFDLYDDWNNAPTMIYMQCGRQCEEGTYGRYHSKAGQALEGVSITRVGVTLIGFTVSLQSLAIFLPAA